MIAEGIDCLEYGVVFFSYASHSLLEKIKREIRLYGYEVEDKEEKIDNVKDRNKHNEEVLRELGYNA